MTEPSDRTDRVDQTDRLYAAEDAALEGAGPPLRRWTEVVAYVESVVTSEAWLDAPGTPPIDVDVQRRSRSARYAAAHLPSATIWIPDGQWRAPVILHELAHLLCQPSHDHGPRYAGAELWLIRCVLGIEAYAALRRSFDDAGVVYDGAGWPSVSAAARS